jgi:PAS domain S-box-containing protein
VPNQDEQFASALVAAADDAIYGLALDGTVLSWNPGAARIFGYAADEIVGTNAVRLLAPTSPNELLELLERVGRGETVRGHATQVYTRDARVLRATASFAPVADGTGQVASVAVVLREQGEVQDHERTRQAAEERYRAILDIAPVALLIVDDRGRIEFANPRAADLFGYDRYELLALQLTHLLPDRVASRRRRGDADELVGPPDSVGVRRDGSEFPVELGVNTLSDGRRRLIAAAIVDLSARRAAEETLRDVARQQAAIADLGRRALEGIPPDALLDETARLVAQVLDVELVEVVELTGDDLLAMRAGAGWQPGIVGATTTPTSAATPAAAALRANEPLIVADLAADPRFDAPAHLRDHHASAALCCAIRGERTRFGVICAYPTRPRAFTRTDATFIRGIANVVGAAIARRRSEEELRTTSETLSTLIAAAPVGVAVLDVDGRVQVWNPAAETLFGVPTQRVADREVVAATGASEETAALVCRVLAGETIRGFDTTHRRPDGSDLAIRVHGGPLRDATGTVVGAVLVLADTTATRRLEEQLAQAQKMESVGRLAGGVAHDFNNLLTGIFGYTSLLADELRDADPDQRDLVRGIRESAEKAAALTAQLLAFSRRQVLQPRVVDVNEVIRGIEPLLRRIIGETVTLVTVPRSPIGSVRADPTQLEQVVVNLVVNARDAMPDGGTVVVETDEVTFDEAYAQEHFEVTPGRYVMLAVTDGGVGMDAETRLHLFEPFFTTKGPGRGTGLGLATTYGIVKQSGGHIWLYSEPGRGTTFKLYFPRVAEAVEAPTAAPVPAVEPASGETILLVEDESAVREITRIVLARHGYRVLVAESGNAAIAIADAHPGHIDLLITDVVMPGLGGRALAEQLQERRPGLRTLYISGYTEDTIVRQGVLEANVAFLAKPFSPDHLARTVRGVLDGRERGAARERPAEAMEGGRDD